jgi:hypothetical protein
MLRRIFGPNRHEVTGEWIRLHNEELNGLYPSPNIIPVIKSRRRSWGRGMCTQDLVEHMREGGHLQDAGVDRRIILKWIFKTWDGA